ncbi:MAG: MgtC/SapB family protein [Gemmatimonadota bacterium]|jgi:uncharacterized membrane protein YhiD involved in acid resistance
MEQVQSFLTELQFLQTGLLAKLALAALLGGVIGWERELSDKPAGLRTNLLICVGAALLAHISLAFATAVYDGPQIRADPSRIAAQIVSGIGFLGAGTIIQARGSVTGLTTAATLWVVAAIGIAVGGEAYAAAVGATGLVLVALVPLGWLETRIERRRLTSRSLQVVMTGSERVLAELEEQVLGLVPGGTVDRMKKDRETGEVTVRLAIRADDAGFRELRTALMAREDVQEIVSLEGVSR